ncbi:MAG: hypothetical protein HS115_01835 [Spirochaetales bacterium]|nr:hypothetical protein [Spirochaetales bacterium]
MAKILFWLFLSLFWIGCGKSSAVTDSEWNRLARFMAGLPQTAPGEYTTLEDQAWQQYRERFDQSWQSMQNSRLTKMASWAKEEIPSGYSDLFYPFSGPDTLSATVFFPDFTRAVFIGLEPIGRVREVAQDTQSMRQAHLEAVLASLRDLIQRSYFITLHMMGDLRAGRAEGVLPVMLVLLVRSGFVIEDVKRVYIERNGQLLEHPYTPYPAGIKIVFGSPSGKRHEILYFQQNLADSHLSNNAGFSLFIQSLKQPACFTKSASYLMHYGEFQSIRRLLFEQCRFILQDDTGIALRYFDRTWQHRLYGEYAPPIRDFRGVHQRDLQTLYRTAEVAALPFSMGYHWTTGKQNMMLSTRKEGTP